MAALEKSGLDSSHIKIKKTCHQSRPFARMHRNEKSISTRFIFIFLGKKFRRSSWDRPAFAGLALRLLHSLAMTDHLVIARNEVTKQSLFSS